MSARLRSHVAAKSGSFVFAASILLNGGSALASIVKSPISTDAITPSEVSAIQSSKSLGL
jgi:hypothetical protein